MNNNTVKNNTKEQNTKDTLVFSVKKSYKKPILLIFLLIFFLFLVLSAYVYYKVYVDSVAIQVNSQKLTKNDYNIILKDYKNSPSSKIDTNNINDFLVKSTALRSAANEKGVVATEDEILGASNQVFPSMNDSITFWQKYAIEHYILENKLTDKSQKNMYAQLVFPFSRYFALAGLGEEQGYGNKDKIEASKKYAYEQAQKALNELKNNNSLSNAEAILSTILKDKELDFGFSGNTSEIFYYDENGLKNTGAFAPSAPTPEEELITKNLSGQTEILTMERENMSNLDGYSSGPVPIAYYFYSLLNPNSQIFILEDYIKNAKVRINV